MMSQFADITNALLEFLATFFITLSIRKIYHDKKVRGISWMQIAFFVGWGYWNMIYYPAIGSPWSFKAGLLVMVANSIYLVMLLYYTWREGKYQGSPLGYEMTRDKTWCETWSGKQFFILDPEPKSVDVLDIAHSLGNLCRYNGHTDGPRNGFYSVAEHCCLLADYCLAQGWGPQRAFDALIHDAGEAYTGDIPRPWKCALPILKQLEDATDKVVIPVLGGASEKPDWLDKIDGRIIRDERAQARRPSKNYWVHDDLEPLGVTIQFWTPEQASAEWLRRYQELGGEMGGTNGV